MEHPSHVEGVLGKQLTPPHPRDPEMTVYYGQDHRPRWAGDLNKVLLNQSRRGIVWECSPWGERGQGSRNLEAWLLDWTPVGYLLLSQA